MPNVQAGEPISWTDDPAEVAWFSLWLIDTCRLHPNNKRCLTNAQRSRRPLRIDQRAVYSAS